MGQLFSRIRKQRQAGRRRTRVSTRGKFRTGRSYAYQARMRRQRKAVQNDIATTSSSSFVYSYGKRRLLRRGQAKAIHVRNATYRSTKATGEQGFFDWGRVFDYDDLNTMMSKVPGVSNNKLLMLRGATAKAMLTNQHQSPCKITIYDCVSKRDTNGNDLPADAFNTGLSDQSGGTVGANEVGITPYKSVYFNQFWKIRKVTNITLDPGASHIHYIKAKVNKVISRELLVQSPAVFYKYFTCIPLVVHHGFPINDAAIVNSVSTASTALDVVWTVIYDFTWDAHSEVTTTHDYHMGAITNEHGIEVMDGVITNLATA